jgi:hypothetical protein
MLSMFSNKKLEELEKQINNLKSRITQLECKHSSFEFTKTEIQMLDSRTFRETGVWKIYYDKICSNCGKKLGLIPEEEYLELKTREYAEKLQKAKRQKTNNIDTEKNMEE